MKKMRFFMVMLIAVALEVLPVFSNAPVSADALGGMTTYSLPDTSLTKVVEGSDGNLWVTGSVHNPSTMSTEFITYKVARTGSYTTYNNSAPNGLEMALGSDGNVWITDTAYVSKIAPDGTTTTYNAPLQEPGQLSTQNTWGIANGPDGNIWFGRSGLKKVGTQYIGTSGIGRITTDGDFLSTYALDDGENISSMASDSNNGVVWYGTSGSKYVIGKMAADGTRTEYTLPSGAARGVSVGPDGNIWFISTANKIGKMTPTGSFTFYTLSTPGGSSLSQIRWGLDGHLWATVINTYPANQEVAKIDLSGSATLYNLPSSQDRAAGIASGKDGNIWVVSSLLHRLVRVGTGYTDNDEDGLTADQEIAQGTSDSSADTDNDGLSDYVESQRNASRDVEFCNEDDSQCAYPSPATPDLYVETDWMIDPSGTSYKPTDSQLDDVQTAYANQGINFHYDNGTYGGGNEVPYQSTISFESSSSGVDFLDYKYGGNGIPAEFDYAHRGGIWHYALFGDTYDSSTSSGKSTVSGPDTFVSYGLIANNPTGFGYTVFNTALEGTIIHELGHTLCLSPAVMYTGQPSGCVFAGVDNSGYPNYFSSMNYTYQMQMVGYSSGLNGPTDDHDDWSAISLSEFNRDDSESGLGASFKQSPHSKAHQKARDIKLHKQRSLADLSIKQAQHLKLGEPGHSLLIPKW
jgi:streptogramin lyase